MMRMEKKGCYLLERSPSSIGHHQRKLVQETYDKITYQKVQDRFKDYEVEKHINDWPLEILTDFNQVDLSQGQLPQILATE